MKEPLVGTVNDRREAGQSFFRTGAVAGGTTLDLALEVLRCTDARPPNWRCKRTPSAATVAGSAIESRQASSSSSLAFGSGRRGAPRDDARGTLRRRAANLLPSPRSRPVSRW